MKRVGCIYRVSTKGQLENDEIPMQREACLEFIKKQKDWVLVKEYYGKALSGYKLSQDKRDDIQEAKRDAERGEIDVLLCYMFDRVGRRAEESPFILKWFNKMGVETWSVVEGQQKFEQHVDLLINYIRFWQAEGESKKTSQRVNDDHELMVKEGMFRGGKPPYGYRLEKSGVFNKKDKELYKLVIDEEQSKIVKIIYDFVYSKGWGANRIARYLNENNVPSYTGKKWNAGVINFILRNPIYKGYMVYGKRRSDEGIFSMQPKEKWILSRNQIKELVIIDEEIWDKVQEIRSSRTPDKVKKEGRKRIFVSKAPLLFVGIIRCGYCNSPLTTTYCAKKYKRKTDGKVIVYRKAYYRCSGKALAKINCEGQTLYSQNSLEKAILSKIYDELDTYQQKDLSQLIKNNSDTIKQKYNGEIRKKETEYTELKKELDILKAEVTKSILGQSHFSPEILNGLIQEKSQKLDETLNKINELKKEMNEKLEESKKIEEQQKRIPIWREEFEKADFDERKILVRELIDEIVVYKDKIKVVIKKFSPANV